MTVGESGKGQQCTSTARWWQWTVPHLELRTVQRIIKSLEDDGYITRKPIAEEGKAIRFLYSVTAKGIATILRDDEDPINPEVVMSADEEVEKYLASKMTRGGASELTGGASELTRPTSNLTDIIDISKHRVSISHDSEALVIYDLYPKKIGKALAIKSIAKAINEHGSDKLIESVTAYAKATASWSEQDRQYIPHPATWFNQARFLDDRVEWYKKSSIPQTRKATNGTSFGSAD
jgi:hypothetical protein